MGRTLTAILASLVIILPVRSADADDNGVAQALHDTRREGKRLCLDGHFHDGNSAGLPSRKAAEIEAIKAWAGFTAWEYGTDWAQWTKAASKTMRCTEAGTTWSCDASARPCKDAVSGRAAAGRR